MRHDVDDSFVSAAICSRQTPCHVLGSASGTSTASTSMSSVWSDAISDSPNDAFVPATTSVPDPYDHHVKQAPRPAPDRTLSALYSRPSQCESEPVPAGLRLNPRRTTSGHHRQTGPPILVRQSDRRINFVDNLVDSSTQIVEAIWPCSVGSRSEPNYKTGLPLRTFIQETLRRSRTSYSTLQLALYYLILLKPHVPRHISTTEQPTDRSSDHPLQCGRRMFLAALILASKYLQDRNYSARAWSRMSGLNTHEINSNEIAFLLAINWKLHVVDDVFQRWTDVVLKFSSSPAPTSPGGATLTHGPQSTDWKQVILGLDPELSRVGPLSSSFRASSDKTSDLSVLSPRSILNFPQESTRAIAAPKVAPTPAFMEPKPTTALAAGRLMSFASALASKSTPGSLPTPRLIPLSSGFCTPAVSAAPQGSARRSAMSMAMAQAHSLSTAQNMDRFHCSLTSPPQGYYCAARRSSLAKSVSTTSSPESMISDSSRSSHCSFASAALSASATYSGSGRCSVPSRCRESRLWSDRLCARSTVPSVPEDYDKRYLSSPPTEFYVGPTGKSGDDCAETRLARRERELEDQARDAASDAARVLQDLHNHGYSASPTLTTKTGFKRNRTGSTGESTLQDNVRSILAGCCASPEPVWNERLMRISEATSEAHLQLAARAPTGGSGKRVCCSAEAASVHPAISLRGRGLWDGILN